MRNYFQQITILTLFTITLASFSFAQNIKFPEPREEILLNDLKVLIWKKLNTGRITIKLRVHSGAAFDPKNKEGTMAMLSEILFPEEGVKKFFEEDLEGKLEIITTHDYLQINATSKSSEFLAVVETLSSAVSNPQISKENFAKVKPRHIEKLNKLEKDSNYIANQAVAQRLYGDFPYGRAVNGTTDSLKRIDFADLIFARQRFLTSDNATLTITGDVDSNYAYKVARRLFGGWQKSLRKTPANFRLPAPPDITPLTVNIDETNVDKQRFAFNALSRKDKDYFSSIILQKILDARYKNAYTKNDTIINPKVTYSSNYLRGHFIIAKEVNLEKLKAAKKKLVRVNFDPKKPKTVKSFHQTSYWFNKPITNDEFDTAKSTLLSELGKTNPADFWFDIYTYKLSSISDEMKKANAVSLKDVQRVANNIADNKVVEVSVESVEKEMTEEETKSIPKEVLDADPKDPLN